MAALTLTVLGASPAAPNPGGACSGYLLRQDDAAVLVDCGSGVAGRIAQYVPPEQLRGVVISHLHPDHYFDLVPLYYLVRFGPRRPEALGPRLAVYVPPGGRTFFSRLGEIIGDRPAMLEDYFDLCDYAPDRVFAIGGLDFTFHRVQHYVLSHAVRVRARDGRVFVFSSDVAPCPEVVEAARDADLFLCESALLDASQDEPEPSRRGHTSAAEAGRAAAEANARQLLITHFRSGELYDTRHLAAARSTFAGLVDLAREGQTYPVG